MSERRIMLHHLADIVDDLWGTSAVKKPAEKPEELPPPPERPEFPDFEQLWKVADEAIDWTEALASETPTDGLTDQATWAMMHRLAPDVLRGETQAYVEVLRMVEPLADLVHFASGYDVSAESADKLSVAFGALPAYLPEDGEKCRRYLAGVSLRAARDLFALLPVTQVAVEAQLDGKVLSRVGFEKTELMKVRFAFVDPVDFVEKCGGTFMTADRDDAS